MSTTELAITSAAKVCGVPASRISSASRLWPLVEARMIVVMLLHRDGYSDERIALQLGRKRCAVLHSRHRAFDSLDISASFRAKLAESQKLYDEQKSIRIA